MLLLTVGNLVMTRAVYAQHVDSTGHAVWAYTSARRAALKLGRQLPVLQLRFCVVLSLWSIASRFLDPDQPGPLDWDQAATCRGSRSTQSWTSSNEKQSYQACMQHHFMACLLFK